MPRKFLLQENPQQRSRKAIQKNPRHVFAEGLALFLSWTSMILCADVDDSKRFGKVVVAKKIDAIFSVCAPLCAVSCKNSGSARAQYRVWFQAVKHWTRLGHDQNIVKALLRKDRFRYGLCERTCFCLLSTLSAPSIKRSLLRTLPFTENPYRRLLRTLLRSTYV